MAGLVQPGSFPIRDVKSRPQKNGRILNPVGYPEMGGLTGPGKWPNGSNPFAIERPTSVRAASKASRDTD